MPKILLTNFSKGELSPRMEGRPDLVHYFEGGSVIKNFHIMRQGGLDRRAGLRFIKEVKDSSKDTMLLPFEASVDDAFIIESGDQYMRFYKNKARIESGGVPIEVLSPYSEAQIRQMHFTQSVDVLFMFHALIAQTRLSRASDTSWSVNPIVYTPPPSFEKDADVSSGGTLTPSATSGTGVTFTASVGVFRAADVGRLVVSGAGRGLITALGGVPDTQLVVSILDTFSSTAPIPSGQWFLRLSPRAALNPTIKEPVGAQVTLSSNIEAFRPEDTGKFIAIYGGLIEITSVNNNSNLTGIIRSILAGTDVADPPAAPAGAWTLEERSWSVQNGFPRTGEFVQGRLVQASTDKQRTTFWMSKPDDFDSYPVGITAGDAIEYSMASKRLNRVEWLSAASDFYIGTSGSEHRATSGKSDEPFGGDIFPLVKGFSTQGSAPIQPIVIANRIIFVDRSRRKVFAILFDLASDAPKAIELTGASEHIFGQSRIRLGAVAVTIRPNPIIYFVREDGQLATLTFYEEEKVIGFTRLVTDGFFESVAVKPGGGDDEVWCLVRRTVNGVTKRYIEVMETNHEGAPTRGWTSMQTDSSVFYKGAATNILTGMNHLEGRMVAIVAGGGYIGNFPVVNGRVVLQDSYTEIEGGLLYDSVAVTMRPAIPGTIIEGLQRSWSKLTARFQDTLGGFINYRGIQYKVNERGSLHSGDRHITDAGWSDDGRITVEQREPFPMKLLAVYGDLEIGGK